MNCSIVIRAYNEERYIGRLLEGIRQQTIREVEIILVDSGSTDGTVSIAESFGAQIVSIPAAEFTFGRSLNLGVQAVLGTANLSSVVSRYQPATPGNRLLQ